jgi:hypothetical protein
MENELTILYEKDLSDKMFSFLQSLFGEEVGKVQVDSLVSNELVNLQWAELPSYQDVAMQLTESFPNIIIETPSTTGIDSTSRFFNGAQLW